MLEADAISMSRNEPQYTTYSLPKLAADSKYAVKNHSHEMQMSYVGLSSSEVYLLARSREARPSLNSGT